MLPRNVWTWKGFNLFPQVTVICSKRCAPKIKALLPVLNHNYNTTIRCFKTSSPKNALPPFLFVLMGKIIKYGSVIGGRVARYWWQKLPQEKKFILVERTKNYKIAVIGLFGSIGSGVYLYYDAHVQETPITKRKRFIAFTDEQFCEISKRHSQIIIEKNEKRIPLNSKEQENYKRVERVTTKLLQSNSDLEQIQNKNWTITVINDGNIMNAFVMACGSIFVFTGLLNLLETDDELAIILGHEMAHVILSHGSEAASFLHLLDLLFIIPLAALWTLLPVDIAAAVSHFISNLMTKFLLELPYDRSLESEADEVGLYMAAKACFDVRAAPLFWAKMAIFTDTDDPLDIEWLSTHPRSEFRQAQLEKWLPKSYTLRESCKCPSLPLKDPRSQIEFWKMYKYQKSAPPTRRHSTNASSDDYIYI